MVDDDANKMQPWNPTEQDLADLRRAEQDMRDGFAYAMVEGFRLRCGKCGREGEVGDRPFPHRYGCPMGGRRWRTT